MYSEFDNIRVAGVAVTLPDNEVDNMSFAAQFGEAVVKKQTKVTGIKTRRVIQAPQTALDLMLHSAEAVMQHAGWTGEDIDVLVFVSGYSSCRIPATAFLAQNFLNIKKDCLVLDVNLACTGTVDGMYTVASLLQQCGEQAKGLLLVGETPTVGGAGSDKTTSMLSSDCGAAVALELGGTDPVLFGQHSDGSRYEVLVRQDISDFVHMDGMEVFQFAITDVVESIELYFKHFDLSMNDIDYFVIHQAQKFIVDKVCYFSGFPKERVINSYPLYGNTGGASDLCTICANKEKFSAAEKQRLFMTGFGAGLSWGIVTLTVDSNHILPVQYDSRHRDL